MIEQWWFSEGIILFMALFVSWFIAQFSKLFFHKSKNVVDLFWQTGGGPSSHLSPLITLLVMVFFWEGMTPLFVLVFALTAIVLRDAVGVRFAEGVNAQVLKELAPARLKKRVIVANGHTMQDVLWGIAIGFVVATVFLIALGV